MNRVSDGDRSTLLSFVSCGASHRYAPQSDEVIKYSEGAVQVREDRHAVGTHEHGLADHA